MQQHRRLRRGARRPGGPTRLTVEALEQRSLPSGSPTGMEAPPDDTLDQANALGALVAGAAVQVNGQIGDSPAGAADVDWYQFTLDQPLQMHLQAVQPGGGAAPVALSLYDSDPFNFTDPYEQNGHHLIAQDDATGDGVVAIDRPLAPGTYYVAVSGAGNLSFNPFLAGSGYDGQTGPYTLLASGTDLGLDPTQGPVVLASDPAPGAVLTASPPAIRVYFSGTFDALDNPLDGMVNLSYSPDGDFAADGTDVPLAGTQFSDNTSEGLLSLAAPLASGYYSLTLTPPDGPDDPTVPQAWSMTFQVAGVEGDTAPGAVADDSPAGAHELGDVTTAGLVQAAGAIGDDPAYDPANSDPTLSNPAADVDLYHFQVTGPGSHALTAEVFAGRIASPLDPALSLFRLDPATHQLELVAVNDNTLDGQVGTDGFSAPLYFDAALFAGLTAGDYYLAVSGAGNAPDPVQGIAPGQDTPLGTVFDPNVSHSGTAGYSTGNYVLNLVVQNVSDPPRVLSVTPGEGAVLDGPPTQLQVQFSEPINLQQLAYQACQQTLSGAMPAVSIVGPGGVTFSPRFNGYDATTNTATLLMLDALPAGDYTLRLSGPLGLADVSGDPLVGNDASGDYVVHFQVGGPARGTAGDPLTWSYADADTGPVHQQTLGPLFPDELATGVNVVREPTAGAARPQLQDAYQFEVTEQQQYLFSLSGASLPAGATLTLCDANGNALVTTPPFGGTGLFASLAPGDYTVVIGGWTADEASGVGYDLSITMLGSPDWPVALTSGPAPAIRLRLDAPVVPPTPAPVTPPATGSSSPVTTPVTDSPAPTSGGVSPVGTPGPAPLAVGSVTAPQAGGSAIVPTSGTDNSATATTAPPRLVLPVVELSPSSPVPVGPLQVTWTGDAPAPASGKPASVAGGNVITPVGLNVTVPQGTAVPGGVNVPFSLVAVLGTSPAGTAATPLSPSQLPATPRLELDLPDPALTEAVLRLVVLTPLFSAPPEPEPEAPAQAPDARGAQPNEAAPPARAPVRLNEWARDAWFNRLGAGLLLPINLRLPVPQRESAPPPSQGGVSAAADGAESEESETGADSDTTAAPLCAAALALVAFGQEGRRQGLALMRANGLTGGARA